MRGPWNRTMNDVVHEEFIQLHVVTKNLQSIRNQASFEDFMNEIDGNDFDLLLVSETWRTESEEIFRTCRGNQLFLSGGSAHAGVGICVGRRLVVDIGDASFHCYSERVWSQIPGIRMLFSYNMGTRFWSGRFIWFTRIAYHKLRASRGYTHHRRRFQCKYWKTSPGWWLQCIWWQWDWQPEWQGCYANAMDGAEWIARFNPGWTIHWHRKRVGRAVGDANLVQLDYILISPKFSVEKSWCDSSIPIGLDHRCVHYHLKLLLTKPRNARKLWVSKIGGPTWMKRTLLRIFNPKLGHCLGQTLRPTCKPWKTYWFRPASTMAHWRDERCNSTRQHNCKNWGTVGGALKQNLLAKLWVCKFDSYISANCDYGGPGNCQVSWDLLHVGKHCGKICPDHPDDVVHNNHLQMNLRKNGLPPWEVAATDAVFWRSMLPQFFAFELTLF